MVGVEGAAADAAGAAAVSRSTGLSTLNGRSRRGKGGWAAGVQAAVRLE